MRASPAFEVSLQRFGVWQGGVLVVALLGIATLTAWLWTWPTLSVAVRLAVGFAAFMAIGVVAWPLARVPAARLRWDGQAWSLARHGMSNAEPIVGELRVAIDLGPWMLLKFMAQAQHGRPLCTWVPVQRRGLEERWHAMRCAVHASRSAVVADRAGTAPTR